jgi:hypothetical protein
MTWKEIKKPTVIAGRKEENKYIVKSGVPGGI